jgi:2-methylisocitrate lyase-like PEP mutase family enzyme
MPGKTSSFRQLIEAQEILIQPGIYDGFSARLAQQMGFKSASISGAGPSETNLGWADVGLMRLGTIREMEQRFLTAGQLHAKYGAVADRQDEGAGGE